MTAPHVPAAFINAIAEEGTKAEAIEYLQKTWNENCALRAQLVKFEQAPSRMDRARALYLAVYEDQGGKWEANESKEVWCDKADRYLEMLSAQESTRV
jgi:hypothetical protein